MKNIPEIKAKLQKYQDGKEFIHSLDNLPETKEISNAQKEVLIEEIIIFLNKMIKHLGSKKPNKSSISNIVNLRFFKLQYRNMDEVGLKCFLLVVGEIINNNFQDAFSSRLNVKSKEFLDLEDCDPF